MVFIKKLYDYKPKKKPDFIEVISISDFFLTIEEKLGLTYNNDQ